MYIGAVPKTPQNQAYVNMQKDTFLQGIPPPDMPKISTEAGFIGVGKDEDIVGEAGRRAMGLVY